MNKLFKIGDRKIYQRQITIDDIASFNGVVVHEVCATYALARDIEWASRQFVLEMKDIDEEGIGTLLTINHKSPAFVGEVLRIEAVISNFEKNELICDYVAKVKERIVATGQTGQKIIKKERIEGLFSNLKNE
jgi:fluoroacetyl-CoA thioesterase